MLRGPSPPKPPASPAKAQVQVQPEDDERTFGERVLRWLARVQLVLLRHRRVLQRGLLILVAGALAAGLLAAIVLGPFVRGRVEEEARRRKLDVEIGAVRPGFFKVLLRNLRLKPQGTPGIELAIDDVRVDLGLSLSVAGISARGGRLSIEGEVDDVVDRLRELRGKDEGAVAAPRGSKKRVTVEDFSVAWKFPSGGEIVGTGLRGARDTDHTEVRCARCAVHRQHLSVEATDVEADLAGALARRIRVGTLQFEDSAPKAPKAAPTAVAAVSADPTPPPLPVVRKRGAEPKAKAPAPPETPDEPVLPLPDLRALRARIATGAAALASRLPEGGRVDVEGLSAKIDGGEPIALGPGPLAVERHAERIHVTFSSGHAPGEGGGTPLSLDADFPVAKGEMTARLAGGPVSLAALGVKEGMRGLTDVSHGSISGKGQLVLSEDADALTFDGEVALHGLSMSQARISPEPLRGIDFSLSARGVLDDHGKLRLDDGELDMGALHLRAHGTVEEASDHFGVGLAIDVLPAACQAILDSFPQGLLPLVRSARVNGTFAAGVNLSFDTRAIDKLSLDYKIADECRMVEVPAELARDRFEDSFTYRTYRPDGTVGEATTGPGTNNWTALDDISPYMVAALLTTEDGAFYRHKGFNHAAIRASVQANLKARRFVRGASTITMQLAKNLFLARDKALSRKIEEVILTDYLEQTFRKDDMMELYLNVVEFGPDVYGITQAAAYYFGRKPEELHVGECFFLASLLPSPIRYGKLRDAGVVSESWMRHLRALMQIAEKNGKISRAELEDGLKEPIAFVKPGDPPPEPRKPVTSSRRGYGDDDDAWRPLD